jgi:hypothetical protein
MAGPRSAPSAHADSVLTQLQHHFASLIKASCYWNVTATRLFFTREPPTIASQLSCQEGKRPGEQSPRNKKMEQYMLLKQIGLAALAATFITGSAAVANAESNVGVGGPGGADTTEAALNAHLTPFSGSAAGPTMGSYAYGYAPENGRGHSSRKHIRANARMTHENQ